MMLSCKEATQLVSQGLDRRLGFFERVQIGTLDILDQSELEQLLWSRLTNNHRHAVEAGTLSRAPSPLTCD